MIKPVIRNISSFDTRKLCSFDIDNSLLGKINVQTNSIYNNGLNRFAINLKNKLGKQLGFEYLSLSPDSKELIGLDIFVEHEYRKGHTNRFRFGEILRLASIIEMVENNRDKFKIYSKNTAVYFHSKYKFEPNITQFKERDEVLKSIANDKMPGFNEFALKAKSLLEMAAKFTSPESQRKFCREANLLINEYLQQVHKTGSKEYELHPFEHGMGMVLTGETLQKNRSFFNYLFNKHNIDYKI